MVSDLWPVPQVEVVHHLVTYHHLHSGVADDLGLADRLVQAGYARDHLVVLAEVGAGLVLLDEDRGVEQRVRLDLVDHVIPEPVEDAEAGAPPLAEGVDLERHDSGVDQARVDPGEPEGHGFSFL